MTLEPQFDHKNPGPSGELPGLESALRRPPTNLYNAAVVASTREALGNKARGNDVLGFGLMALPDRAAVGGGSDQMRQMGIPQ